MVEPTLATLRITDGHQGKAETPMVKRKAFQLTTGEARPAPDVVTVIYFIMSFIAFLIYAYVVYDHV